MKAHGADQLTIDNAQFTIDSGAAVNVERGSGAAVNG